MSYSFIMPDISLIYNAVEYHSFPKPTLSLPSSLASFEDDLDSLKSHLFFNLPVNTCTTGIETPRTKNAYAEERLLKTKSPRKLRKIIMKKELPLQRFNQRLLNRLMLEYFEDPFEDMVEPPKSQDVIVELVRPKEFGHLHEQLWYILEKDNISEASLSRRSSIRSDTSVTSFSSLKDIWWSWWS